MNKINILKFLQSEDDNCRNFKDGGLTLIIRVVKNIHQMNSFDKNSIFEFFKDEIKYNNNGLWSLCLEVTVELNWVEMSVELERIYGSRSSHLYCSFDIIRALLRLEYDSVLYEGFFKKEKDGKKTSTAYLFMIFYLPINKQNAINLLANYYSQHLIADKRLQKFIRSRLNVLLFYINRCNDMKILIDLICETKELNTHVGTYMFKLVYDFIKNNTEINGINKIEILKILRHSQC